MRGTRSFLVAALLLGAFGLGGCATSHVGNTWQCPLVQGERCLSVASADPVAPERDSGDPGGSSALATDTPLYRSLATTTNEAEADDGSQRRVAKCAGGCRPRAWVSWLFRKGTAAGAISGRDDVDGGNEAPGHTAVSADADERTEDASQTIGAPSGSAAPQGLRTAEVIGRIWIGPYVDSRGVYHEASWVRVVLEPAGWKRP